MKAYLWAELKVGLAHSFEAIVTEPMMMRFSELSGDYNPLHLDEGFARQSGFSDRVVFGMLAAAFYSRLVGMYLPGKFGLLLGVRVDFCNPVFVGRNLVVSGSVNQLSEAVRHMQIKATISMEGILTSRASISVAYREQ